MAKVNVEVDVNKIPPKIHGRTKFAQAALVNQVHADMNPYVPALSYDLRNQSNVTSDNRAVIYNVPYARRRFYEPASRYTTPGTTARWDLKAKSIHGKSWPRVAGKAMNLK